jgi:hypothetical protein
METASGDKPTGRLSTLRYTLIFQGIGLLIVVACPAYILLAHFVAVASWGIIEPLLLVPAFLLIGLVAVPVALSMSLLIMVESWRRFAANLLALCVLMFPLVWLATDIGMDIRHNAFVDLERRSKPLVQAIHDYETDHGHPPGQLNDLVPTYMSQIPATGIGAYPEYEYIVPSHHMYAYYHQHGHLWVLRISTPDGLIDFDEFVYFPNQQYPTYGYGGYLERIGDWAYLHE